MRVVSGRDAHELRGERPGINHHTVKVLHLERPAGAPALAIDELRAHVAHRLARVGRLEPLRWRLAPIGRGRVVPPAWVVVDPDLDVHVRTATLGAAGVPTSATDLVARLLETPLDRGRPLWQLHLVDEPATPGPRDDGIDRQWLALVVHHALGGGQECVALLEQLFGAHADDGGPPVPADPAPSTAALLALAGRRLLELAGRVPAVVADEAAARRHRRTSASEASEASADGPRQVGPLEAPVAAWNHDLVGARRAAAAVLPLPEVVRVGRRFGATVNEVLLTLVGGALADQHQRGGGTLELPLTAVVPVHRRPGTTSGNHCTSMGVDLVAHEPDPVRRLGLVVAASQLAKARHRATTPTAWFAFSELGPAHDRAVDLGLLVGRRKARATYTTVVSLVRGPRVPLSVGASSVAGTTSYGEVTAGIGCNVTAWSTPERLDVGISGVPGLEVDELAERLRRGFDELLQAAGARGADPADPAPAPAPAARRG